MAIPIIDIFAGPGGLGEGFSSLLDNDGNRKFDIQLSIEKDENAHKTLTLRSFFRKFPPGEVPDSYYELLKSKTVPKRDSLVAQLFEQYPEEALAARKEAWCAELGNEKFPSNLIDKRIKNSLNGHKDWLLIGGPPCQAYSLVGRARVGGIANNDHRVYLYKEYLRIIAKHQPAVFVMENVKGLLSAKVKDEDGKEEKVFDWIKRDLQDPSSVFTDLNSKKYKIYSLSTSFKDTDSSGNPVYEKDSDFLIKAENYGVPQKRHRVILLGIRSDVSFRPETLKKKSEVTLKSVIDDLPEIRSGLGRSLNGSKTVNGKVKRNYKKEIDTDENWTEVVNEFRQEIRSWNGFAKAYSNEKINTPDFGLGSEYIQFKTPARRNPLEKWYSDKKLSGVINHESRTHLKEDLKRYMFSGMFAKVEKRFPRLHEFKKHSESLLPEHKSAESGKFADRFRVQLADEPATTVTSHISKDGHYFIHYDPDQCRSLTVREAARIQTFPDNYLFCGPRTSQYHQVGNAVPPYLAWQIAEIVEDIFENLR